MHTYTHTEVISVLRLLKALQFVYTNEKINISPFHYFIIECKLLQNHNSITITIKSKYQSKYYICFVAIWILSHKCYLTPENELQDILWCFLLGETCTEGQERQENWYYLLHAVIWIPFSFLGSLFDSILITVGRADVWNLYSPFWWCLLFYCSGVWENTLMRNVFFSDNFKTVFDKVLLKSSNFYNKC